MLAGPAIVVPLRLATDDWPATDADLVLAPAEAEQLHAALCNVLGDQPAPRDAPDCRRDVQGGLR